MEPVPYRIQQEDVDEVLNAYASPGSNDFPEDVRAEARRHVLRHVLEIDEVVRAAPEDDEVRPIASVRRAGNVGDPPGANSPARRELALAAIEDLLISDGFIDASAREKRVFPATTRDEPER
jgi:hypothetical protein